MRVSFEMNLVVICGFVCLLSYVGCDTPANCTYEDIRGDWVFYEGRRESDSSINCTNFSDPVAHTLKITLLFLNIAFDELGNKGHWNLVYNQGFEVVINYRKYFAFSLYEPDSKSNFTSHCDKILPGWSHDVLGKNWACYNGQKVGTFKPSKPSATPDLSSLQISKSLHFERLVNRINKVQKSWTAAVYPELRDMSIDALFRRAGGPKSRISSPPSTAPAHHLLVKAASQLPVEFDWRNVDGINYISPVRNEAEARAALHGEHYGGDMIFPESWNTSDAGIRDTRFRWTGYPGRAVVPYVIDESAMGFRNVILQGMEHYHRQTCIKFVPRTNQRDFVRIFYGNGCWSIIGMKGGQQDLSLGKGCQYVGLVIHELGHAIGLFHEHQRSDRDWYINVYPNNVVQGQGHNFERTNPNNELIYTQYDYDSIMHYGNYAFSRQPNSLMTMEAKNRHRLVEPYEKSGFTQSDLVTIKKLYQC